MKLKLFLLVLLLPFVARAATNQFSDIIVYRTATTSNLHVRGSLGVNTNLPVGTDYAFIARNPPGFTYTYMQLRDDGVAPSAGIYMGDINAQYFLIDSDGSNPPNARFLLAGATIGNMNFFGAATLMYQLNATSLLSTYGFGASWAHTFNGGTWTLNHTVVINGAMTIPTTASGAFTNG